MRRLFARLVLCLGLMVPTTALIVVPATPASAGDGYWSTDPCNTAYQWKNDPAWGYGTLYYRNASSEYFWVGGRFMDVYRIWGWQCGDLDGPVQNGTTQSQFFQRGYIYQNANGTWSVHIYGWGTYCCY